jgi:hypothetical protein
MERTWLQALALLVVLGVSALAQSNIAGTWVGETQGRGGTQTVTLVLVVDGDELAGTFTQGEQEAEITEGAIDGNTVTFQRAIGPDIVLTYTGEVDGNTLTLTPAFDGGRQGAGRFGGRGDGQDGARAGGGPGRGGPVTIELTRQ